MSWKAMLYWGHGGYLLSILVRQEDLRDLIFEGQANKQS